MKCHQVNPTFETARAEWTLCFSMWSMSPLETQIIGRYQDMSPGESYSQTELIWNSQLIGRYKEMSPGESYSQAQSSFESSFETVN